MHQALQIQEILLGVFSHYRLPGWWLPTSELAALARTCRAFKESALNLLWETLHDPSPLAKCLPPEASHHSRVDNAKWFQGFTSPRLIVNIPTLFHQVLLVWQITYTDRVEDPSELHTSHSIHHHGHLKYTYARLGICRDVLEPSYH